MTIKITMLIVIALFFAYTALYENASVLSAVALGLAIASSG